MRVRILSCAEQELSEAVDYYYSRATCLHKSDALVNGYRP